MRQSLEDFIAEYAPRNYSVEPWVSLAWIMEHGSPLARSQAKTIGRQIRDVVMALPD
jgi:hypothetical protein